MKRLLIFLLCIAMVLPFAACKKKDGQTSGNGDANNPNAGTQVASKLPDVVTGSMTFNKYGTITFEIYPNLARESALNFIYLVNSGHFNGVIVDRLVKDHVIQAGMYESGYKIRETEFPYTIKGEFESNGIDNSISFVQGTMAWARSGDDYNSASTEFCIYTDSTTCWDFNDDYAGFGMVTDGFDILKKINKKKTYAEKPTKELMITSVVLDPVTQDGFDASYEFPQPNFIKKDTASSGN